MICRVIERATTWSAIAAFVLGLWLGYRSAVNVAVQCRQAHTAEKASTACPEWLREHGSAELTRHRHYGSRRVVPRPTAPFP